MEEDEKKKAHRLTEDELMAIMLDDSRFRLLDRQLDGSGFEMASAASSVDADGKACIEAHMGRFGARSSRSPVWIDPLLGLVTTVVNPIQE